VTDRWIDLEGCVNARDLGGLPTVDGRTTRSGVLLRTDTLQQLTPSDVAWLRDEYGLRTVLDLRTPKEAAVEGRGGLALEAVDYYNIPFVPDAYLDPTDPRHEVLVRSRGEDGQASSYLDYLTRGGNVVRAVRLVAAAASTPLVFHCAAGKDRTGVLAALVLDLAGVERAAIVEDYLATNERIERLVARLVALPTYSDAAKKDVRCRAETMPDLFAALDDRHGGTAQWAKAAGVTDAEITRLRDLLVG
jgi:protein tyrosine/serine phosphatase